MRSKASILLAASSGTRSLKGVWNVTSFSSSLFFFFFGFFSPGGELGKGTRMGAPLHLSHFFQGHLGFSGSFRERDPQMEGEHAAKYQLSV